VYQAFTPACYLTGTPRAALADKCAAGGYVLAACWPALTPSLKVCGAPQGPCAGRVGRVRGRAGPPRAAGPAAHSRAARRRRRGAPAAARGRRPGAAGRAAAGRRRPAAPAGGARAGPGAEAALARGRPSLWLLTYEAVPCAAAAWPCVRCHHICCCRRCSQSLVGVRAVRQGLCTLAALQVPEQPVRPE